MVALTAFRSRVLLNVQGCPDPTLDEAILDACIEFCEKTNIIQYTSDTQQLSIGQSQVELDVPYGQRIVLVQRVWVGTQELLPLTQETTGVLGYAESITGVTPSNNYPRNFTEISPGVVAIYPRPDKSDYFLTARISLKPSRASTVVDDKLFEDWVNVIAQGALSILYTQKTIWQDTSLAAVCRANFLQGINTAIIESRRGRSQAEDVVTPVLI